MASVHRASSALVSRGLCRFTAKDCPLWPVAAAAGIEWPWRGVQGLVSTTHQALHRRGYVAGVLLETCWMALPRTCLLSLRASWTLSSELVPYERPCEGRVIYIVQELCESRGGRPGLSVLTSLLVSVDVKNYSTVLRHWSQLVPNMSNDIWGH